MLARQPIRLLSVGLAGGLGGATNAALCYLSLPVRVEDSAAKVQWHIVPAGFAHGAALALVAVGAALLVRPLSRALSCLVALAVGWMAGYVSAIPLHLSAFDKSLVDALVWPWQETSLLTSTWSPFAYFGGVGTLVYAWLRSRRYPWGGAGVEMLALSVAAALGSLWWWTQWGPSYFSLLHGAIWGIPVGWALSRGTRAEGGS